MDRYQRVALALAVVIATLAAPAAVAQKAQPSAGPWAKVMPLASSCYDTQDQFLQKSDAALAAVQQDLYGQSETNNAIQQSSQQVDMMQVAQLMQQKMMEDPQNAAKYLALMQAGQNPAAVQAEAAKEFAKEPQMRTEEQALLQRYKAALAGTFAPAQARIAELRKKAEAAGCGFGDAECSIAPALVDEYNAAHRDMDKAYQAFCPQWWGAAGQVQAFMQRYKDYLLKERVPFEQKTDEQTLESYKLMNVAADDYRSLAPFKAAEDYVKLAGRLYRARESAPFCPGGCVRGPGS